MGASVDHDNNIMYVTSNNIPWETGVTQINDKNESLTIEDEEKVIEGDLNSKQKNDSSYFRYKLPVLDYLKEPIEIVSHNEEELREKGKQLKYALNKLKYA